MGDVTITAASVKPGANAQTQEVTFGGTVTQGMPVYMAADGHYKAADCMTSTTTAAVVGIALTAGGDGQPGVIQTGGNLTTGVDLAANTIYVLSAAGKIAPAADFLASTDYLTIIGASTTTSNLKLSINATGSGKTG